MQEFGFPAHIRGLPSNISLAKLLDYVPGRLALPARYARTQGALTLLKQPLVWGVGAGHHPKTNKEAVVYLAESVHADEARGALPEDVLIDGERFPVVVAEFTRNLRFHATSILDLAHPPYYGPWTGSKISTRSDGLYTDDPMGLQNDGGGTLSGIFPSAGGHSLRGVTNAHVALSAGIDTLINNLPNSLRQLLESPKGTRMFVWDSSFGDGPGNAYELFEVDTNSSILTPIPFIPGAPPAVSALAPVFIYTDICAGNVRPRTLAGVPYTPVAPAVAQHTIRGTKLNRSRFAFPGEKVYKYGNASGTVWGSVFLMGMVVVIPFPPLIPLLPLQMVVLPLDMYILNERPGDSGGVVTLASGHHALGVGGLGTIVTTLATPAPVVRAFAGVKF